MEGIIVIVILAMMLLVGLLMPTRYGLAKVVDKNQTSIDEYELTVIFMDGSVKTKRIAVSLTVYYKFNPGDYITIAV